ncbi:TRAP transporter small permease [Ramlibacter sp. WS9]|uniref:TRAP transporter small permease n=1 Tax=Ramlibacter sp. WS9 TaxID=1882741 RepID=UPI00130526F5|nr:TRAP transporter small permease [Ramlibacter sp. WS9]
MKFPDSTSLAPAITRMGTGLELVLAAALIAAVLLNVTNVVERYIFDRSIPGADEFQIYLMVALAFFGSVVAAIRGQHLRMDVLARSFPRQAQQILNRAEAMATAVLCGFVCWISTHYALRMFQIGTVSENVHFPMWLPHAVVAVAFAMLTLFGVIQSAFGAPAMVGEEHPDRPVGQST